MNFQASQWRNTLAIPRDNAAPLHQRRSSPYLRCARKDGNIPTLQLTRAQHRAFLSRFVLPTLSANRRALRHGERFAQIGQGAFQLRRVGDANTPKLSLPPRYLRTRPGLALVLLDCSFSDATGPSRHLLSREACRSFRSERPCRMIISTPIPMNQVVETTRSGAVRERHSRNLGLSFFKISDKKRCWRNCSRVIPTIFQAQSLISSKRLPRQSESDDSNNGDFHQRIFDSKFLGRVNKTLPAIPSNVESTRTARQQLP